MSDQGELHMRRAIELARAQHGRTGPNPSVGCVIVGPDGRRISEGATADGGHPHAEEMALGPLEQVGAKGAVAVPPGRPCSPPGDYLPNALPALRRTCSPS